MKIFIPISTLEVLDARVRKSIEEQTIETEILLIENFPYCGEGRKAEHEARNQIKSFAKNEDDFVFVQDANLSHLYLDNFEGMINAISADDTIGCIALWYKDCSESHVKVSCNLWRRFVLERMPDIENHRQCCCKMYKDAIEKLGFKMVYLDNIIRVKEI